MNIFRNPFSFFSSRMSTVSKQCCMVRQKATSMTVVTAEESGAIKTHSLKYGGTLMAFAYIPRAKGDCYFTPSQNMNLLVQK